MISGVQGNGFSKEIDCVVVILGCKGFVALIFECLYLKHKNHRVKMKLKLNKKKEKDAYVGHNRNLEQGKYIDEW